MNFFYLENFPAQQLSLSDEDALAHFKKVFGEALKNSWKTSLNWAFGNKIQLRRNFYP